MCFSNHIQAVEDGTVIEVFLGVASRTSNDVTPFGKLEKVAVDGAGSSFLTSSNKNKFKQLFFNFTMFENLPQKSNFGKTDKPI